MQRHLGGDALQRLHFEMRCAHPGFDGAEWMFDGLAAHLHLARLAVEPRLHALKYVFAFPSSDTAFLASRAVALQRTSLADIGPIDPDLLPFFFARHAVRQMIARRTHVVILGRIISEIAFVETALRFRVGGRGLRNIGRDAGVFARGDFVVVEVAFVGDHFHGLGVECITRLLRHR